MKAEIRQFNNGVDTIYVIVWDGWPRQEFPTVTEAQIFCLANHIPFKPWE